MCSIVAHCRAQIVFFEMNYQFGTAQERIVVLEKLRQPEIEFPSDWDKHRTRQRQSMYITSG